MSPKFSIVIPSRNRPVLLRKAIDSVLGQSFDSLEVIVVNDGSDGEHADSYAQMAVDLRERVRFINLVSTHTGHGQSYAINTGAHQARGEYVGFLDDDDYWTDAEHLARAAEILANMPEGYDVYLANQHAYRGEERQEGSVWLEDLLDRVKRPLTRNAAGAYDVSPADLMQGSGFGHLNTTLVRRDHFLAIGGMDADIRYECDRDFFLRVIDAANTIVYVPDVVSRHNIPIPSAKASMSTAISMLQKHLYQTYVLDKAILFARHREIRVHACRYKGYALKKIAMILSDQGELRTAGYYAREALLISFSLKWLAYTALLIVRGLVPHREAGNTSTAANPAQSEAN